MYIKLFFFFCNTFLCANDVSFLVLSVLCWFDPTVRVVSSVEKDGVKKGSLSFFLFSTLVRGSVLNEGLAVFETFSFSSLWSSVKTSVSSFFAKMFEKKK